MKTDKLCLLTILLLTSCISTRHIPDDDQLFVGLTKISYDADTLRRPAASRTIAQHQADTRTEVEAALATAPNGALFGSSYYRSPFSWRLWVYNHYSGRETKFARWMVKTFGKPPVLMSQVNPALRASVAQSVLRNNGYFRGRVSYTPVPARNPRKSKLAYQVSLDSLFTYDSVAYVGYPAAQRQLIDSTADEALLRRGDPFSVGTLESERNRIGTLLRDNGYYYYSPAYTTYLADTTRHPGHVDLRIQLADSLPPQSLSQWYVGNIDIRMRRTFMEQLNDSIHRRHLHIFFNGKKPPIRPRVVLKNMRLFPRRPYSYERYQETAAKLNATGVFSAVDFQFTPRHTDTLDLQLTCTFDKPYDFYFETDVNGRTIGRYGPEMKIGFTRRNVFRGAEKLDVNLHGSYEWQKSSDASMNSYQYGADATIEFPRIIAPFVSDRPRRRRLPTAQLSQQPTTLAKVSSDIIRRPGYYKMHIATGEWTYNWQSSEQSRHELSPLTLKYQYMNSHTDKFAQVMSQNLYLLTTMSDHFIPKMRYTYTYNSPSDYRNPVRWETTFEESGNVTALYDVAIQGRQWDTPEKTMFKNPYAQFLRVETDLTKTWRLSATSRLVGHFNGGLLYFYGNSTEAPFSELFYVGGANSVRAFTVRSIGPGAYADLMGNKQFSYLMQNGDVKLAANLEYRARLFGNMHYALFLDMGNVWKRTSTDYGQPDTDDELTRTAYDYLYETDRLSVFKLRNLPDQLALGTGVGIRYDLSFLVIRIDWGIALHTPYDTGKSGYFNTNHFRDAQALHFAVGYPF